MQLRTVIEFTYAAGAVVAAGRLLWLGLNRRFPALFVYLVFLAAMNFDFGLLDFRTNTYFYNYVVLEPVKTVLSILAVRELFTLIFEDYPGIRTVGRWVMYGAVALSLAISLALTRIFWTGGAQGRSKVYYMEISQRWVFFALAIVIGALMVTLSRYPLRLPRDNVVSSACFSALFLADACRLLIDSLSPPPYLYNLYVDLAESVFVGLCLLTWALLLKPEEVVSPARVTFSTPREEHLLQELTALNQVMARVARR